MGVMRSGKLARRLQGGEYWPRKVAGPAQAGN
jgi:hypothetical protein